MSALSIWQRLSEVKAGIAAIGARLWAPSKGQSSPSQRDEQTTAEQASIANSSALGAAHPYVVHLTRPPTRYY
jgi:hypothetical protein